MRSTDWGSTNTVGKKLTPDTGSLDARVNRDSETYARWPQPLGSKIPRADCSMIRQRLQNAGMLECRCDCVSSLGRGAVLALWFGSQSDSKGSRCLPARAVLASSSLIHLGRTGRRGELYGTIMGWRADRCHL